MLFVNSVDTSRDRRRRVYGLSERRFEEGRSVAPHVKSGVEILLGDSASPFDPLGRAGLPFLHQLVYHSLEAHGHTDGLFARHRDPLQGVFGDEVLDAQLGYGRTRNVGAASGRGFRVAVA